MAKELTLEEKYHSALVLLRQSYIHNDLLSRHLYMVLKRIYEEAEEDVAEDVKKIEDSFIPKKDREQIESEFREIQ